MEELKKLVSKISDTQKVSISISVILIICLCGDLIMSIGEINDSYAITSGHALTAFIICGLFWGLGFFSSYRE